MKTKQLLFITLCFVIALTGCTDASKNKETDNKPSCILYKEAYNVPLDADLSKVINHSDTVLLQRIADTLSWKTFIALNWPAKDNGQPDTTKCLADYAGSTTTWEHWIENNQLLGKSGVKMPLNGKDSIWVPKACLKEYEKAKDKQNILILNKNTVPGSRNGINKKGYQLIDQQGNPTYYQIYYNTSMADYIQKGGLNTLDGQKKFVKEWPQLTEGLKVYDDKTPVPFESVFFSIDVREDSIVKKINYEMVFKKNNTGALMMKVAWKILSDKDDISRFYTRDAIVAINNDSAARVKVGLVGLHIAHKTAESPQWIWSTFEHIDNAPEMDTLGNPQSLKGKQYSFFNSSCTTCAINTPDTSLPKQPSQIVRIVPISKDAKALNQHFQAKLQNIDHNVWQYYDLIGTQWPFSPSLLSTILVPAYPLANGNPRPTLLSNTAMESFDQKSSCMGCHANAFILNKIPSDFVWGLIKVKK